jgi:putative ABC transport system substrate-binding protein
MALAARAQQPKVRRIGVLMNTFSDDAEGQARLAAFHQGLQQLGWTVGHNVRIDYRWGGDDAERHRRGAAELVALGSDVILASGTPSVAALRQATDRIPVVFAQVADPVGAGFVESLARPAGNITGFAASEFGVSAKWLELLKRSRLADAGGGAPGSYYWNRPVGGNPGGRAGAGGGVNSNRRARRR